MIVLCSFSTELNLYHSSNAHLYVIQEKCNFTGILLLPYYLQIIQGIHLFSLNDLNTSLGESSHF